MGSPLIKRCLARLSPDTFVLEISRYVTNQGSRDEGTGADLKGNC